MLRRALINLIRNSAQAIRDQSRTEGKVRVSLTRSGDFFIIDIDDDGPGIPADSRERIFDPYVTTKHDGTGLGLAIVKKVVVEHGGIISALEVPRGARVPSPSQRRALLAVLDFRRADQRSGKRPLLRRQMKRARKRPARPSP
jgi:signal transduction histidine kinase